MPTGLEKIRLLLPHWIEHNTEHTAEFRRWAEQAGNAAVDILAAAEHLEAASVSLRRAQEKLGEPSVSSHHHLGG